MKDYKFKFTAGKKIGDLMYLTLCIIISNNQGLFDQYNDKNILLANEIKDKKILIAVWGV